jgi:hypothetical protein
MWICWVYDLDMFPIGNALRLGNLQGMLLICLDSLSKSQSDIKNRKYASVWELFFWGKDGQDWIWENMPVKPLRVGGDWNMICFFHFIYEMSSLPLTKQFFKMVGTPPTSNGIKKTGKSCRFSVKPTHWFKLETRVWNHSEILTGCAAWTCSTKSLAEVFFLVW